MFSDFSVSLFIRRHFSVEINQQNKIALRKDISGILRCKIDFDGSREDGSVIYNFNVVPQDKVEFMVVE